jgi:hypothetical protein
MGDIVSGMTPYVWTAEQLDGTLHTEAWLQWEFLESYASGGISIICSAGGTPLSGAKDVAGFFKYVKDMQVTPVRSLLGGPASGAIFMLAPNPATLDHAVASGYPLMQAYLPTASGIWGPGEAGAIAMSGVTVRLHIIGY